MQNKLQLKSSTLSILICGISLLILPSCQNSTSKPTDTKETAKDQNKSTYSDADKQKDSKFCIDAAELNLTAISLAQLAQLKTSNAEVKAVAKMIEVEHNTQLNALKELAAKKEIALPGSLTDNGKEAYGKLDKKTGKDFDKEYCSILVSSHKNFIEKFEKANEECVDADIKNWAFTTLPSLRTHLEHSIECEENCKKAK